MPLPARASGFRWSHHRSEPPLRLPSSVLPAIRHAQRLAPLPAARSLDLALALRDRDPKGLAALLAQLYDPRSPSFHRFLSPSEFARRFAPLPAERVKLEAWLRGKGLVVRGGTDNGLELEVQGTVAAVQGAFGTRLNRYRAGRERFYANREEVQVPTAIAHVLLAVSGLENRMLESSHGLIAGRVRKSTRRPLVTYSPDDLARMYDLRPLWRQHTEGQGQTIAIVAHSDYRSADIGVFDSRFHIPSRPQRVAVPTGEQIGAPLSDDQQETDMDVEVVQGIAPRAHVLVYESPNTESGITALWNEIVSQRRAQIITTTWGASEHAYTAQVRDAIHQALQEAAAQGQSVVAASGDNGAFDGASDPGGDPYALAVDYPASDPLATAVGGTRLQQSKSKAYGGERVWSDASNASEPVGSGGGLSTLFQRPDWQTGPGVQNSFSNGMRQVPDVAGDADSTTGYAIYTVDPDTLKPTWLSGGGTSASAPLWAGFLALTNQALRRPMGFFDPTLYALARIPSLAHASLHDVTHGTNLYYPATRGWDFATGWGSLDAEVLLNGLTTLKHS
jgi:kumamolisin